MQMRGFSRISFPPLVQICEMQANGRWATEEEVEHINVKELRAVLLGLQSLASHLTDATILVRTDNCTTVAYINNMGGCRSVQCDEVAIEIWNWALARNCWVFAEYLPGDLNVDADHLSRHFNKQ